jgi:hypothetical protein
MSAIEALNRVAKWRSVFAGWQLGTRSKEDPESQAVRDHREVSILLRVEASALVALLVKSGVFTAEEWEAQLEEEADALNAMFAQRFPGMEATEHGVAYDLRARDTMQGWKP